jgi:LPS export ABC transporter permease LptG
VRILSRYLVARFFALFATTLFVSTLAIVIVEMLLNFDNMLRVQKGAAGVLTYLLLRIPSYYLRDLVPVAAFTASFLSLGLAARWLEITAIKAGGISPQRVAFPVLLAAAFLALCDFAVNETWVVQATQQWKQQRRGETPEIEFGQGSFWYHRGRTIYNIGGADRATRTLRDVSLFERDREGRLVRSIHAEQIRIDVEHRWHFEDAVIRRFDPLRSDRAPRVETLKETVMRFDHRNDIALMDADATLLSVPRLREYILARLREGDAVQRLVAVFHARLTDPIAVLLLAMLAIPLALRVEQTRSLGQPALLGVGAVAAFFLVRNVGVTLAAEGVLPPAAAPWLVLMLFAGLGVWSFARIPR